MAQDRSNPNKYQQPDPLKPKKRGRPRKENVNGTEATQDGFGITFEDKRTNEAVIAEVLERFNVLRKMAKGIGEHKVRSLIISGAAGIGKTYTLLKILETLEDAGTTRFKKVSGYISTTEMYRLLYTYRHEKDVLMFDDTDNIFYDDDSLNLMKAALDTIPQRILSYRVKGGSVVDASEMSEDEDSEDVPNEFEFKGCIVFVTNIDFYAFLTAGRNRVTPHVEALLSRTQYLDMALHAPRAIALWIDYMMRARKMLLSPEYGMTEEQSNDILMFITENFDRIYKPSLRTAVKLVELVKLDPADWKVVAGVTMRRPIKS